MLIRLSGEVVKRKKKLSKKYYGTSHIISREEAEFIYEKGCSTLVLGAGQHGNVTLSPPSMVCGKWNKGWGKSGAQTNQAGEPKLTLTEKLSA